jgi:hypothetical protein
LIGLTYSGTGYLKERNGQKALMTKMDDTNSMLSLIPSPSADLQQRLAAAQKANLAAKQNLLPADVDITQVIKTVLAVAGECNVNVIPLNTDTWTNVSIEGINYRVLTISLSVKGSFANLTTFVNRFYGNEFTALVVETVTINQPGQQIAGSGVTGADYTGIIGLGIYTQAAK